MNAVRILAIPDFVMLTRPSTIAGCFRLERKPGEPNGTDLTEDGFHFSDSPQTDLWRRHLVEVLLDCLDSLNDELDPVIPHGIQLEVYFVAKLQLETEPAETVGEIRAGFLNH